MGGNAGEELMDASSSTPQPGISVIEPGHIAHPAGNHSISAEPAAVQRILVVDDEPRITSMVSRALTRRGYQVEKAGDIEIATALVREQQFDLIVLDLRLPDGDGVSFLGRLVEERPELRVLVLSALADVDTRVRVLSIGAADYLSKPFSIFELVARVEARLRDSAGKSEEFVNGAVVLEMSSRRATSPDGTFALSEREFLLLRHLMQLRGKVASREELLETIWGITFDYSSNVVDVTVKRLRDKLGQNTIQTVRNVGYRMEP
jgi:DNA-binding response OmpR family regulator